MAAFALQQVIFMLCGLIWPVESFPEWLKYISKGMPFTEPMSSLQALVVSGVSLVSKQVLSGILVSTLYMFLFLAVIIAIIIF